MLGLFVLLVMGLLLGIFAIQNNTSVAVNYGGYIIPQIPLYGVVIGSMLIGVALSWILSLFGWASNSMKLFGKDRTIHQFSKSAHDMESKIEDLEKENLRLRGEKKEIVAEHQAEHTPTEKIKERIGHAFS